jgi:hypothetical protein
VYSLLTVKFIVYVSSGVSNFVVVRVLKTFGVDRLTDTL